MTNSRTTSTNGTTTGGSISEQNKKRMVAAQRRIWNIFLIFVIMTAVFWSFVSFDSSTYTNSYRNFNRDSSTGNETSGITKYAGNSSTGGGDSRTSVSGSGLLTGSNSSSGSKSRTSVGAISNSRTSVGAISNSGTSVGTISNSRTPASGSGLLTGSILMTAKDGWDISPVVLEKHKLIFFTIPKTGTTVFKLLFRRMMGFQNWSDMSKPDILPHHPKANGLRYLHNFPKAKAENMLTSNDWTKAIFVREPKDRLLSAYLDKVRGDNSWYVQAKCCTNNRFHLENFRQVCMAHRHNRTMMSLLEFVRDIIPHCIDPHWQPQARRIEPKIWDTINFVGYFHTIQNDTKRLLQQIGAWDEYGSSGWSDDGTKSIFETNNVKHKTSAGNKFEQYYTPEIDVLVNRFYKQDYHHPVMNFTTSK